MSERITRAHVQTALEGLQRTMGDPADAWQLDYYAMGGGYRVTDGQGGSPLGHRRLGPRDMAHALDMAAQAVWAVKWRERIEAGR